MQHVFAFIGNVSSVIGKKEVPRPPIQICNCDTSLSANICCFFFKQTTQSVSTFIQPGILIFLPFKASQQDIVSTYFEIR